MAVIAAWRHGPPIAMEPTADKTAADRDAGPLLLDATMFWSSACGGVRRYVSAKQGWLARQGRWRHALGVPGASRLGDLDLGGVPVPFSGGYRCPLDRRALAARMRRLSPDLIEAGDPYRSAWAVLDAAQDLGIPAVAFCHSNLLTMAQQWVGAGPGGRRGVWARTAARRYLQRLYRQFDRVLVPSPSLRQVLEEEVGLERVEVQALGVDTDVFRPRAADPRWRADLQLASDARVLLYVGRFAPEKHLDRLAEVVEALGPPYVLLLLGAGAAGPPDHPRVRRLPCTASDQVLARCYANADLFVHAGDQETFGLAALEAMACGTPVVVRGCGGLADLVAGGAGIAVVQDRVAAWAEAIDAAWSGDRDAWSRRARQRALDFDWNRVLPRLVARYDDLTARTARRA